jgi:hypothetical protein
MYAMCIVHIRYAYKVYMVRINTLMVCVHINTCAHAYMNACVPIEYMHVCMCLSLYMHVECMSILCTHACMRIMCAMGIIDSIEPMSARHRLSCKFLMRCHSEHVIGSGTSVFPVSRWNQTCRRVSPRHRLSSSVN